MKVSLTIYIDPTRLNPDHKLHEVHLKVADSFAHILNEEDLIEISSFDLSVDYDQERPNVPPTMAYDWLKRFNKSSQDDRKVKK